MSVEVTKYLNERQVSSSAVCKGEKRYAVASENGCSPLNLAAISAEKLQFLHQKSKWIKQTRVEPQLKQKHYCPTFTKPETSLHYVNIEHTNGASGKVHVLYKSNIKKY